MDQWQTAPTGFPVLDQLTTVGGYPRGRITQMMASDDILQRLADRIPDRLDLKSPVWGPEIMRVIDPPEWLSADKMSKLAEAAYRHNTAVVFLTPVGLDVPKALKFFAYLRISIQGGSAKLVKTMLAANQGYSVDFVMDPDA